MSKPIRVGPKWSCRVSAVASDVVALSEVSLHMLELQVACRRYLTSPSPHVLRSQVNGMYHPALLWVCSTVTGTPHAQERDGGWWLERQAGSVCDGANYDALKWLTTVRS